MDRVAFLRDQAELARSDGFDRTGKFLDETADEMESLLAIVDKLQKEKLDKWMSVCSVCKEAVHHRAHVKELEATVAKLPKCWRIVDGELREDCPVVPGMVIWYWFEGSTKKLLGSTKLHQHHTESSLTEMDGWKHFNECFNSREAAEFALAKEKG